MLGRAQGGRLLSVPVDRRIGSELFGYRLEALLGRGGMGVVYRAYDRRLKRLVALKLIAPELAEDERFRERFLAETEVAASLEHPNVVPIHDAGEFDGQLYLAMRYVEGSDLKTLLTEQGALDPARSIAICSQVAGALDEAHDHGLVHRDVKPSNVLLDQREHVYLADYGLSRRLSDAGTAAGLSLGTPAYAAPEQIQGGDVDGRADVYSLGCVLYECLTGEAPFTGDSDLALLWAHVQEPPPKVSGHNPALPEAIDGVIATAIAKDPDNRYASCDELIEAASDALGVNRPVTIRDRKALVLTALGVAIAAAAVVAGVLLSQGSGHPARPSTTPTFAPKVDSLQRIDPKTNRLMATIGTGAGADAVAAGEGAVLVASTDAQAVSRIDPLTNAVVKQASTAGQPRSIALDNYGLWVTTSHNYNSYSSSPFCTLSLLDPHTLLTDYAVSQGQACGPVVSRGGLTWYGGSVESLLLIDPLTGEARLKIPVGNISEPEAHGLALGAGAVWLASPFTEEVLRFDRRGRRTAIAIGSGSFPSDVAVGEGGVWVVDSVRNRVVEIDPSRKTIVRMIAVGHDPVAVAAGAGSVWVANHEDGTVSRIDPRSGRVTHFEVGPNPTTIAVGEGAVWVTVHPS
jgi:serine/threonine protein kinase